VTDFPLSGQEIINHGTADFVAVSSNLTATI
jgi:hypothetical protein